MLALASLYAEPYCSINEIENKKTLKKEENSRARRIRPYLKFTLTTKCTETSEEMDVFCLLFLIVFAACCTSCAVFISRQCCLCLCYCYVLLFFLEIVDRVCVCVGVVVGTYNMCVYV
jgi:hypothetical protein